MYQQKQEIKKEWHIATKRLKNKRNLAVLTPGGHIQADPSGCWFQISEQQVG
jgi:hypothetical protein